MDRKVDAMLLVDKKGIVHKVKVRRIPFKNEYCAYIWVIFPIVSEAYRSTHRRVAENGLAKKMWRQGWSVIRE